MRVDAIIQLFKSELKGLFASEQICACNRLVRTFRVHFAL